MRSLAGGVPWSGRESHLPYMRVLAGSASVKWAEKITYPTWKYLQEVYPEVAEKITYSMWKYAALKWAENITFPTYVSILAGGVLWCEYRILPSLHECLAEGVLRSERGILPTLRAGITRTGTRTSWLLPWRDLCPSSGRASLGVTKTIWTITNWSDCINLMLHVCVNW